MSQGSPSTIAADLCGNTGSRGRLMGRELVCTTGAGLLRMLDRGAVR
jgi:hypothetical protein